MIPRVIVDFVNRATVAMVGTRDQDLVPHVHRVSGWMVGPDRKTMTCLVAEGFTEALGSSLEDNGQLALTICEVPSHETYQFKGNYVGSRSIEKGDLEVYDGCRQRFVTFVCAFLGFEEDEARAFVPKPSVAVSFEVREVFVQTPGPAAGRRLVPMEQ